MALASSIAVGRDAGLGDRRPGELTGGDHEGFGSGDVTRAAVKEELGAGDGFAIPGSALRLARCGPGEVDGGSVQDREAGVAALTPIGAACPHLSATLGVTDPAAVADTSAVIEAGEGAGEANGEKEGGFESVEAVGIDSKIDLLVSPPSERNVGGSESFECVGPSTCSVGFARAPVVDVGLFVDLGLRARSRVGYHEN